MPTLKQIINDHNIALSDLGIHRGILVTNEPVEVIVRKPNKDRSNNQNRYYFGVVVDLLSKETGYTEQEMHECLKWKFLRKNKETNIETVRSTADLTTVEFEKYMTDIRQWASAELNCFIPDPNDYSDYS